MPITAITISNFKGISDPVRIELKPITLLFGPNSAGKSTVLQALQYAYEIFCNRNFNPDRTELGGSKVDLGGFRSFVHKHDLDEVVTLRIDMDVDGDIPFNAEDLLDDFFDESEFRSEYYNLWDVFEEIETVWVEVEISWDEKESVAYPLTYEIGINDEKIAMIDCSDPGSLPVVDYIEYGHDLLNFEREDDEDDILLAVNRFIAEEGELSFSGAIGNAALPKWGEVLPLEVQKYEDEVIPEKIAKLIIKLFFSALLVGPGEMVRDALKKLSYLGPIREVPNRSFIPQQTKDIRRFSTGLNAWDSLQFEEGLIKKVNKWMEKLGINYSVKQLSMVENDKRGLLKAIRSMVDYEVSESMEIYSVLQDYFEEGLVEGRIVLHDELNDVDVYPIDVGIGISQVLPVIVEVLNASFGAILSVEQPELHIHPKLQVELADIFISSADDVEDSIFLIETHSEHLMLRFLKRIRETTDDELDEGATSFDCEDLAVYYVHPTDRGTRFKKIRVDEDGEFLDRWPEGFFAERAKEVF
ncbi:DUF3696 domain-containing protein [Maridesulfovibrio sp.]|uniref:DUF3696 domain-containing protein n=1 Tax=Maridesulfovibrio sp. TaxID=2795000 RepID=UPI0029C9EBC1|nr:AAA family ATPase [Maridesulfovibrio sp.]